jgi:hypothetical protein
MMRNRPIGPRRVFLLALLATLLGAWLLPRVAPWPALPYAWKPWAPLQLDAPPDRYTRQRLARLDRDDAACLSVLADAGMRARLVPNRVTGPGCGFDNALEIRRSTVGFTASFTLSCRAAVSLALWERHVLAPAARDAYDSEVAHIEHFGSYACRNLYGRSTGRRSQHATADAFDVAGVMLRNGERVRVLDGWDSEDPRQRRFLRAIRDGACQYFDAVLSPDYNAAHRDHLHLDRGGFLACR